MRSGIVITGALLVIFGLVFVSFIGSVWGSYEDQDGGVAGTFSPQLVGLGMVFLGFVLLIAGLAASQKEKQTPPTFIIQTPTPVVAPGPISQPEAWPSAIDHSTICPQCENVVPQGTRFCPACGATRLKTNPMTQPLSSFTEKMKQSSPNRPKHCRHCGATLIEGGKFCIGCGCPDSTHHFVKRCQDCGADNPTVANHCYSCGTKLVPTEDGDVKASEEHGSS